jgi:hypothetical protein
LAEATATLTQIEARRSRAATRVEELEREQSAAHQAVHEAVAAIAENERRGGRPADRQRLEEELGAAREAAQDVALRARIEGARRRVADLDAERQRLIAECLPELVAVPEAICGWADGAVRRDALARGTSRQRGPEVGRARR